MATPRSWSSSIQGFRGLEGGEAVALDGVKSAGALSGIGPMTPVLSSNEMGNLFRSIYRDAGMLSRELVALRRLICPYEPITRWVPSAAHVLDFGCGAGALLALSSERRQIASGIGCDVSSKA